MKLDAAISTARPAAARQRLMRRAAPRSRAARAKDVDADRERGEREADLVGDRDRRDEEGGGDRGEQRSHQASGAMT